MKRRVFLASLISIGLAFPMPANAQTAQDQVVRQLQAQGYLDIRISKTWLGRVRILARRSDGSREIVLNPASGAILRDYINRKDHSRDDHSPTADQTGGSGSDESPDDDHDDEKDDEKDDNSGPDGDDNSGSDGGGDDDDDDDDD